MTPRALGETLPALARASVQEALARDELPLASLVPPANSVDLVATFVTITKGGELRGCMGGTVPRRPLLEDVKSQARSAAFRDPRFAPVEAHELDELRFEVSVLSDPEALNVVSFDDACRKVKVGEDGVIVRTDVGGALFLPKMWETFSSPQEFLTELWKKAGLPERYFEADVALCTFSVSSFEEPSTG